MPLYYIRYFILCFTLLSTQITHADLLLNWQMVGQAGTGQIAIKFKDKDHILISAHKGFKLLKLKKELYLMQSYRGLKVAFALSKFISVQHQNDILANLPQSELNFLPVMIINGSTQVIQGYKGHVLLLKDYKKSITVVSSQDEQHMAVKNALLPILVQLSKKLPKLANTQLIEILKHSEFGLPLRIDNRLILTKSETIDAHKNTYSLDGYKIISSRNDLRF